MFGGPMFQRKVRLSSLMTILCLAAACFCRPQPGGCFVSGTPRTFRTAPPTTSMTEPTRLNGLWMVPAHTTRLAIVRRTSCGYRLLDKILFFGSTRVPAYVATSKIDFDYYSSGSTFTDLDYKLTNDTTMVVPSSGWVEAKGLDDTYSCTSDSYTVSMGSYRSVYFRFDTFMTATFTIDNIIVSFNGCECGGSGPSCDDFFDEDFGISFASGSVCSLFPDNFETCAGNGPYITSGGDCGGTGDECMSFGNGFPYSEATTKCLDLSSATSARLEFNYGKADSTLGPEIDANVDGGAFSTIWTAPLAHSGGCIPACVNLTAYLGEAEVRLLFSSATSGSQLHTIDDIELILDDGECFTDCTGDGDCTNPGLPYCETGSGNCVECLNNGHCDDSNVCTNDACDVGGTYTCSHINNTDPCDDGQYCNGTDTCSGGTCVHSGDPCPGPDGDGDCAESCDEGADNCTAADPDGSACDDGNACADPDTCSGGSCVAGPALDCDDSNVCTDDSCNPTTGCEHANNTDPCDDTLYCNGTDTCSGGTCSAHTGNPCVGGGECNESCNETTNDCYDASGTACGDPSDTDCDNPDTCDGAGVCLDNYETSGTGCTDDGNECTDDECDGAGNCTHPNNTAPCDDGQFCNGADTCSGGTCSVHAGDPCVGGGECNESCNETTDDCYDASGTACGDPSDTDCDNPDTCDGAGVCLDNYETSGTACTDDGNVCTDDECDGAGTCTHPNNTDPCDDGVFCNGADTCSGGTCSVHDGNPCVGGGECNESCNETADDCYDAAGTACGDPSDTDCDNPDTCDGAGTCLDNYEPSGTLCNDGLFCTDPDTCQGGICVSGPDPCAPTLVCDEGLDACITCATDGDCDDGDVCNGHETCVATNCVPGTSLDCSYLDADCEMGACDPVTGCYADPDRPAGLRDRQRIAVYAYRRERPGHHGDALSRRQLPRLRPDQRRAGAVPLQRRDRVP